MIPQPIIDFMETHGVPYEVLPHLQMFTAQGVAASLHTSGREFAKTVILRDADGRLIMAVVPGSRPVDLEAVKAVVGRSVQLASEQEFSGRFPGCEVGAEPPFGKLYGMPVYFDESLREQDEIVFNAGTHTEAVRMRCADFVKLVEPVASPLSLTR